MPRRVILTCISIIFCWTVTGRAQTPAPAPTPTPAPSDKPPMKAEELEQLLAPIALYPDSLLTQVLMASTYPVEIVQADRWTQANKNLKGDVLAKELEKQTWDESVKSLVNFPDVLHTMSEKLDVTMKLGDAFIGQQKDVLNTVQILRAKAQKEGNLKSSEQMKVSEAPMPPPEPAPAGEPQTVVVQQPPPQIITIESSNPEVIYVPSYNPTVVYGSWPYPSYPPYPYYPPPPSGYWASNAISFGLGVACGAAWGYAWGNCNWGGGNCDIDVNRNTNFNRNIDRSKAQANIDARRAEGGRGTGQGGRGTGHGGRNSWQHDPSHRKGASYRDNKTASKYGGVSDRQAAQARDSYRGRADSGRQNLAGDTAGGRYGQGGAGNQPGGANRPGGGVGGAGNRPGGGGVEQARPGGAGAGQARPGGGSSGVQNRPSGGQERPGGAARPTQSPANRPSNPSRSSSSAFDGANRSGSSARSASQRGQTSRASSSGSRSAPSRSAPSRSGGGGGGRSGGGGGRSGGGGGGGRR